MTAVRFAVLTVSDTRDPSTDRSGARLAALIEGDGHIVADRVIVRDDADAILARLHEWVDRDDVDAIVSTGGTGLTGRDVTPEALQRLGGKDIPGFGELFRWLSYAKIGTATIQSRACAVVARGTFIFALPGSTSAVEDAWDGILRSQFDAANKPCNFVDLIPRLNER